MRLMLLFSFGTTLDTWVKQGLVARENRYYSLFNEYDVDVEFLTYGENDQQHQPYLGKVGILPKKKINHLLIYAVLAPFLHWKSFRKTTIFKSNQSQGSLVGLLGRILVRGSRFVVRCGWVRTKEMMIKEQGLQGWRMKKALFMEWLGFRFSDAIIAVTPSDARYVSENYGISPRKITVIPNAVDEKLYSYEDHPVSVKEKLKIVLIGRLVQMKNFQGVLHGLAKLNRPCEVTVIGDGPYKVELEKIVLMHGLDVNFLANVGNDQIPKILAKHNLFMIIQTHASGMPKVILEAMSAGLLTISSNIRTHRELIEHGENGFLCEQSGDDIAQCMQEVLGLPDETLNAIRKKARTDVEERYSMTECVKKEMALYKCLLKK
ncbi:MAG: glycosyltransferase [Gammaproteobacteria bacterium]|nr:glycosyltransferase [Gammaproteobacteria bacterium]